jgi:hypothetical protein
MEAEEEPHGNEPEKAVDLPQDEVRVLLGRRRLHRVDPS